MNRTILQEEPRLRQLVANAIRRARRSSHPVLVSLCRSLEPAAPLSIFARGRGQLQDRFYWSVPGGDLTLVGLGAAATLSATGHGRFATVAREWGRLTSRAMVQGADAWGTGPILMGGFSFLAHPQASGPWSGFPGAVMILPRMLWTWRDDRCWLTVHAVLRPQDNVAQEAAALARCWTLGDTPVRHLNTGPGGSHGANAGEQQELRIEELDARNWQRAVVAADRRIQQGELEKVVLARRLQVTAAQPWQPEKVLERLADETNCYTFAVARGERCFLGASPERLVRLENGQMTTMCLAGSRPRGGDDTEDQRLAHELLSSDKERREHEVVVRALREALQPVCQDLSVPPAPQLLHLRDVQHLLTPVSGRVAPEHHVLDLVARLHPTPAVAGFPRRRAVRLIHELERLNRGWYAGAVGWLDARARGEFAVAIRSGLLAGQTATLYAGCGIVAGSDPDQEYAESRLKFRAMLAALDSS